MFFLVYCRSVLEEEPSGKKIEKKQESPVPEAKHLEASDDIEQKATQPKVETTTADQSKVEAKPADQPEKKPVVADAPKVTKEEHVKEKKEDKSDKGIKAFLVRNAEDWGRGRQIYIYIERIKNDDWF